MAEKLSGSAIQPGTITTVQLSSSVSNTVNNAVLKTGDTMTGALLITASDTALNVTNNIVAGNITLTGNVAAGNIALTGNIAAGNITLTGNVESLNVTNNATANTIFDHFGNLRKIPISGSEKTTSYTLSVNDIGRLVVATTGGSLTVPNTIFSSGDVISLYNNTSGNIVMTMRTANAFISGNNTNRSSINLSVRGIATILYINSNSCIVTGSVV